MDGLHSPGTLNSKRRFRDLRRPHSINSVSDTLGCQFSYMSNFLHLDTSRRQFALYSTFNPQTDVRAKHGKHS